MKKVLSMFLLASSFLFAKVNVALVMSSGGMGSSYNRMPYEALVKLKSEGKINDFKFIEPATSAEDYQFLNDFSNSGKFDLVIGLGSVVASSMKEVQKIYPNQKYMLLSSTEVPNTTSLAYKEADASFLAGALAAMMSKSGVVGTIPGMDTKGFNKYANGFRQGAQYIKKDITVLNNPMPSSSASPFNDPVAAKNIALLMHERGADVIFVIAENSGMGVYDAAAEKGFYAIGSDSNEDGKKPGVILTSVLKRSDMAVYNAVKDFAEGKFTPGLRKSGLHDGGMGLTDFKYTKDKIPADVLKKLDAIKADIISGKIVVTE